MKNRTQPSLVTQLPPHTKTTNLYTRRIQHISHHTPHTTHRTPHTTHRTLHTTHHAPHTAHHTPHTTHHTPHTTRHTPLSKHFQLFVPFSQCPTPHSSFTTPYSALFTHNSPLTNHRSQFPMHSLLPTPQLHFLLSILHSLTLYSSVFHCPFPIPTPHSRAPSSEESEKFKFMQQKGSERRKKMSKRSETIGAKET